MAPWHIDLEGHWRAFKPAILNEYPCGYCEHFVFLDILSRYDKVIEKGFTSLRNDQKLHKRCIPKLIKEKSLFDSQYPWSCYWNERHLYDTPVRPVRMEL